MKSPEAKSQMSIPKTYTAKSFSSIEAIKETGFREFYLHFELHGWFKKSEFSFIGVNQPTQRCD